MAARVGKVKLATDKTTGRTKITRVHAYDASKARKIAKSKAKRVVSPAKAVRFEELTASPATVDDAIALMSETVAEHVRLLNRLRRKQECISFQYTDLTGRKPKIVKATRAV